MKYSNELKVGLSIILSVVVFILGVRFFEDLPLFRGSLNLETEFEDAGGLIPGNLVRINGMNVGSVQGVSINPETNLVRVNFQIDSDVRVPEGSTTKVSGFDALGVVRMDLVLGPPANAAIPDGGFVPSETEPDLLASLTDRAPDLVNLVDSVLVGLDETLAQTSTLLGDPSSDLRQTLVSVRGGVDQVTRLLREEQGRISGILDNAEQLTGNLNQLVSEQGDSLGNTVQNLNQVLARLDQNLIALESTTAGLDEIIAKLNRGEGTLGLMLNDDSMYYKLDSTLTSVNGLLEDFKQNPKKYLREMRLVDIF